MKFIELASARYSEREMTDKKVSKEDVITILDAGRIAPTAKNRQEQRFVVIESEEYLEKLRECTRCHFNAQTVIVLCNEIIYDEEGNPVHDNVYSEVDMGIVIAHMALCATDLGINSTIVKLFDKDKLKEELKLDDNIEISMLLPIGYGAKGPCKLHEDKHVLEDITKWY